ncbi:glutamate receptor ionotropic, delta-1 [Caerostris extrusa]|uniref:Glutamate receptor ionotropic, delta-1 n=1 Tax=Caerostris extrusa TaxID=172846 RepID=A0AAV4SHG4_CAEEX|nr:glutamate receptor ionotropic, delta-1 [Caerostris extrusa]
MTYLPLNERNSKAVDFSIPYLVEESTFITPRPPTKVAPIRTFHELSRAVQSGDHKLYTIEFYVPELPASEEDHLKALGRMVVRKNWVVPEIKYVDISFDTPNSSQTRTRNYALLRFGHNENILISEDTLSIFNVAFAYSKNFCCISKLNSILLKLRDSGLNRKLWQDASFKFF